MEAAIRAARQAASQGIAEPEPALAAQTAALRRALEAAQAAEVTAEQLAPAQAALRQALEVEQDWQAGQAAEQAAELARHEQAEGQQQAAFEKSLQTQRQAVELQKAVEVGHPEKLSQAIDRARDAGVEAHHVQSAEQHLQALHFVSRNLGPGPRRILEAWREVLDGMRTTRKHLQKALQSGAGFDELQAAVDAAGEAGVDEETCQLAQKVSSNRRRAHDHAMCALMSGDMRELQEAQKLLESAGGPAAELSRVRAALARPAAEVTQVPQFRGPPLASRGAELDEQPRRREALVDEEQLLQRLREARQRERQELLQQHAPMLAASHGQLGAGRAGYFSSNHINSNNNNSNNNNNNFSSGQRSPALAPEGPRVPTTWPGPRGESGDVASQQGRFKEQPAPAMDWQLPEGRGQKQQQQQQLQQRGQLADTDARLAAGLRQQPRTPGPRPSPGTGDLAHEQQLPADHRREWQQHEEQQGQEEVKWRETYAETKAQVDHARQWLDRQRVGGRQVHDAGSAGFGLGQQQHYQQQLQQQQHQQHQHQQHQQHQQQQQQQRQQQVGRYHPNPFSTAPVTPVSFGQVTNPFSSAPAAPAGYSQSLNPFAAPVHNHFGNAGAMAQNGPWGQQLPNGRSSVIDDIRHF
ncbi:unnamed protein product [Polarella glacialis]|uniref:Uncharacterized protein n=1 Tax=Polarella glacialis TaxID=89957 RepID=A0A813FQB7_POLGL|nr:unnamed protein product [Polarella glacialis]